MSKTHSKKRYLNYLYEKTFAVVEEHKISDFETDAVTLSVDLGISRANVSRMLNELWRENLLIKLEGRPTYYLHRECIKSKYRETYIPSVIAKEDTLWKYVAEKKRSAKAVPHDIIGSEKNESLGTIFQEMNIQLNYEFHYKAILFSGEKHTGKNFLIHTFIRLFQSKNHKSLQTFEINWQLMKYDREYLLSQLQEIEQSFYDNEAVVVYIKNFDEANPSLSQLLFSWLEEYEEITKSENNKALVIFHSDELAAKDRQSLKKINHSYFVKNFNEKTIKEKYQFILKFMQQEANKIKLSIECPVSVINCILASTYQGNLFDLKNEIQMTIARAKYQAENRQSKLLTISFDELSDQVLNDISNVSAILQEIKKVNFLWKSDLIYFIPDTKQEALAILTKQLVDVNGQIAVLTDEKITIRSYVQQLYAEKNHPQELMKLQVNKRIYGIVKKLTAEEELTETIIKRLAVEVEKLLYRRSDAATELPFLLANRESERSNKSSEATEKIDQAIQQLEVELQVRATSIVRAFLEETLRGAKIAADKKISILVICHGKDIAQKYVSSIRTRGYEVICEYVNYTPGQQKNEFRIFLTQVMNKIEDIDQGKGVVLLTDTEPLTNIAQMLSSSTAIKLLNLSPISLPLLTQVCQITSQTVSTFEEVKNSLRFQENGSTIKGRFADEVSLKQTNSTYQILTDSLTFLDPRKVLTVANDLFTKILEELSLTYREDLQLRFIFHCAFMIERGIRKEPLKMKQVSAIIDKQPKLYQAIEKNIYLINEIFGIEIVIDEMVRLSEIFHQNSEF